MVELGCYTAPMARKRTKQFPPPCEYPPNAWLRLDEAAAYMRISPSGLRAAIHRAAITPDGRGPRGTAMFRVATIDLYLASRYKAPVRDEAPRLLHGTNSSKASSRTPTPADFLALLAEWQKEDSG